MAEVALTVGRVIDITKRLRKRREGEALLARGAAPFPWHWWLCKVVEAGITPSPELVALAEQARVYWERGPRLR